MLRDLNDPKAVLAALTEFDRLGRAGFLDRYGFGEARQYFVEYNGGLYDSKAIAGAAHGFQFPADGPLRPEDFSGGEQTEHKLRDLGFDVLDVSGDVTSSGRVFGHVPGYPVGSTFANRTAASESGVHRPRMAGISYAVTEGADSVVVSGGYEDDEDYGDLIVYTGHGGNDPDTGKQIADQKFTRGNFALARNAEEGLPVRVVRGAAGDPLHSPPAGLRYDGLFYVERYWHTIGKSGFRIWQYRLVRMEPSAAPLETAESAAAKPTPRVNATVQRLVRSSAVSRRVKDLHGHQCQVCGLRVETPIGPYAEGAHIRPLGRPHDGPDVAENVLCLCPNDHVRFDAGAIWISDSLEVIESATGIPIGPLRTSKGHAVSPAHVAYHRETVAVIAD